MDQSQKKLRVYAVAAIVVLFVLFVICRLALRQPFGDAQQEPPKTETTKSLPRHDSADFTVDAQPTEAPPVNQSEISTVTNAAMLYRQAFALYNALTNDEKTILIDWRTNVDAAVEAELCEKLRPICDILHQATAVTNCDWGIEPLMPNTLLPHLNPARGIARAAIWNAAHCRGDDLPGASDDVLSALQLGRSVSSSALIGSLVDMAIQGITESYVAANIGLFRGAEGTRLAASFSDTLYEGEPSLAMEQEGSIMDHEIKKLASVPADEFERTLSEYLSDVVARVPPMDRTTALAYLQQVADLRRELANALTSGSVDEYEAWQQKSTELQNSNPLAKDLAVYDKYVDRADRAAVNRAFVEDGLAVEQGGPTALQAHPDPSNGLPFVYTETADGFELQSGFKTNGVPLKMQFK